MGKWNVWDLKKDASCRDYSEDPFLHFLLNTSLRDTSVHTHIYVYVHAQVHVC